MKEKYTHQISIRLTKDTYAKIRKYNMSKLLRDAVEQKEIKVRPPLSKEEGIILRHLIKGFNNLNQIAKNFNYFKQFAGLDEKRIIQIENNIESLNSYLKETTAEISKK